MIRTLTIFGLLCGTLAVTACNNETNLTATDAELEVSPHLTDLGTLAVGSDVAFDIQIDHTKGGSIEITNIVVQNVEGEFFSYDGETRVTLERDGTLELAMTYSPTDEGYHRGTVTITHKGLDSPVTVDVRAHAILPEATLWPLGLDFGPVEVGDFNTKSLTLKNQSDLELVITEANFSNTVFNLGMAVPLTVTGNNELVIPVEFHPENANPAQGSLTLRAGDVALPQVALRGNDCENGSPAAYDQDGDGYTTCGGDCDDDDLDIRPGGVEVADGADQDCDGDIDEGTEVYDDDGDCYCEVGPCVGSISLACVTIDPDDCNDGAVDVNPGMAPEVDLSNGIDDDCDGIVDQGTTDTDFDGYSPDGGDCDDNDPNVFPGAPELPDFADNDCDGFTDEGTVLFDDDGDGYCEDASQCSDGSLTGDCDDDLTDANNDLIPDGRPTNPGAAELPDWRDNDCDGTVDEGTDNYDDDGDGYTETGGDCDDNDPADSPAMGNIC